MVSNSIKPLHAGKIYVLFAAKRKTPVKQIRKAFLLQVLKVATPKSWITILEAMPTIYLDSIQRMSKIDIILRSNSFQGKYSSTRSFSGY